MKNKIQTTIALLSAIAFVNVSMAGIPVTCVNCSTSFTQALEYVKDIEQMVESVKRYTELVKQTENAITNTMNLPTNLLSNLQSQIRVAVANVNRLNSYKADMGALLTIFTDTWPELRDLKIDDILAQDRIEMQLDQFSKASEKIDNVLQSNFQLTGQQLQDLQDSGEFDDYLEDLLSSKTGRQQAIEAGNQINALTVHEMRQTRALLANYVQAQTAALAQEHNAAKLKDADLQQEMEVEIDVDPNTLQLP
ncbi:P-type conjugative transfer protein TrbJ [Desulfobacter sp.]|uniref:P-type conjugative transfer protein TrbJ n=1 Tax=Desulfobacter sp. TaxID=2294 RepID=UPI003D141F93